MQGPSASCCLRTIAEFCPGLDSAGIGGSLSDDKVQKSCSKTFESLNLWEQDEMSTGFERFGSVFGIRPTSWPVGFCPSFRPVAVAFHCTPNTGMDGIVGPCRIC